MSWKPALDAVNADPDNLDLWEALLTSIDESSASSSTDTRAVRDIYDRLLAKFPLLYGYWLRYATMERDVLKGDERRVYERAVCAFPSSMDLWLAYISLEENEKDVEKKRVLYKRAAAQCGRQFLSHDLWDSYIQFEQSVQQDSIEVAQIYRFLSTVSLHQYTRYVDEYKPLGAQYVGELGYDSEQLDAQFEGMQKRVNDRYKFESEVRRNYMHVFEIELEDVDNWNDYLDYMEENEPVEDTRAVYEQCLVPCALYDVFWLRYVRWLRRVGAQEDEIRGVYRRASTMFVPVSRPWIRLQWALFEESVGNSEAARSIYAKVTAQAIVERDGSSRRNVALAGSPEQFGKISVPVVTDHLTDCLVQRFEFERRQEGLPYVIQLLDSSEKNSSNPVISALLARYLHENGDTERAQQVWSDSATDSSGNSFWCVNYFEWASTNLPGDKLHEAWHVISHSSAPPPLIFDISRRYMDLLDRSADPLAMQRWVQVDQALHDDGLNLLVRRRDEMAVLKKENGHPGVALDVVELKYSSLLADHHPLEWLFKEQGIKPPKVR